MRTHNHPQSAGEPVGVQRFLRAGHRSKAMQFSRHYAEMVVAMVVGMFALGMPLAALLEGVGVNVSAWETDARELLLLSMTFTMSVPMAAWMRYRGHGWAPVWEMTASMFVPSFAAIALLWGGSVEATDTLLLIQHAGMLPSMLAVMLLRLDEYTGHHHHAPAAA
jgi:hypothetical protein